MKTFDIFFNLNYMTLEIIAYQLIYIFFGLLVGSFLNVCIYRIPAAREEFYEESPYGRDPNSKKIDLKFLYPRHSICPSCKNKLLFWHNIPLLSWLLLKGKCAFCSTKISVRYPVVELLTAILSVLSFSNFGLSLTGLIIFAFSAALLVIAFIDYDYYIIPNVISLPGTGICFGLAVINQFCGIFDSPIVPGISDSLWGILIGGGFLWIVAEFYLRVRKIEGLGMGDVKLLAMTGALLGAPGAFYTIFIGSVFGSIIGIGLIIFTKRSASQHIPFGPYLVVATLIYIFSGNELIQAWVGLVTGNMGAENGF